MTRYTTQVSDITTDQLEGFFVGWPNPPSTHTHLELLKASTHAVVALREDKVVGFVTAVSDGVLSAYIPLLEVLPAYQGQGIGKELIKQMIARLDHLYMIDVVCDEAIAGFYDSLGFERATAMIKRNYERQSGRT